MTLESDQLILNRSKVLIHWFRRDLRLEDNRGLSQALQAARKQGVRVLPVFIFDDTILSHLEDQDDARVTFIHKTIAEMQNTLRKHGTDILCMKGKPLKVWRTILDRFDVVGVTVNEDYEPLARARDREVEAMLAGHGATFTSFKDQVIFGRAEVVKDDGLPYTVFTPFAKKWRKTLEAAEARGSKPLAEEKCGPFAKSFLEFRAEDVPSLHEMGFIENTKIQFPSPRVPSERLTDYAKLRDLPAIEGTSHLGMLLRFGTVSIRKLVSRALELRAETWLSELIWREFFMQILWHFPHVAESAFRPEYDRIHWRNNEAEFAAWCEGRTGYPLVDAGMRELNATGFMHNRVRMVTGSFLVKHLLIDWRWGEAYFARKLLDFDLSANNGNWQWVAGSGCDAAPYFRVFNPELQAKRFDPKSEYIRKWIPEFGTDQYPAPIVDHKEARARVLRAYGVVKDKTIVD